MEITKPNDILVATLNSPSATAYDLMANNILGENTSLKSRDEYKSTDYIQKAFKKEDGKFDDIAFNSAYDLAQSKYAQLTNDQYIKNLDKLVYSPFDITRPKDAKTFNVGTIYSKEINPFKELKGWTGVNSINENPLSLRELAQKSKVYDPETNTWTDKSLNDLSLLDKVFGDTLVYAQYDEDGAHKDMQSNQIVNHKKGDWKLNEDGDLFIEKLGKREMYGKQVVNPMDTMTADGSFWNKFDFFDSDEREKSIVGTTFKLASQIAPFVIPGFNAYYGGVAAAMGLASVLPTFYKSLEGILFGDTKTGVTDIATAAENYIAKFSQQSLSDEAQSSMFNYEQLGQMVTSVFSQIYEQRAAASLSKYIKNPQNAMIEKKILELTKGATDEYINQGVKLLGKVDEVGLKAVHANLMTKIPGLKELYKKQSEMAKALNLGYMALITTGDIYGQALQGGYDRRTAGFAALTAAAGQYGIMMNNRMGDWFLDKTTGYTVESNKALMRKSVTEFFDPIKEAFKDVAKNPKEGKIALGNLFVKMKNSIAGVFLNPTELGENLFKHSIIEGVEEVTEQVVLDATKGIIDTMSYLGLTKKQGTFGGWDTVFSQEGFEKYLANLVGGMIGGPMFEFNTAVIEPHINSWISGDKIVKPDVKKTIYQLVGNGEEGAMIEEINRQRKFFGNNFINKVTIEGDIIPTTDENSKSEADVIADNAIGIIKNISSILHMEGLVHTNEEIVKKAFIDQILIDNLLKAKGDSKVGIEGLVLNDYTEAVDKIVKINSKIKELSATDADKLTNKESISQLKDEAKIYKKITDDILDGKSAQKYFDQAMFYLNKTLSGDFVTIDRETYSQAKYGKSFNDLPIESVGLTQERLNKEWTDYTESKDLRKDLAVSTEAYLNLEGVMNAPISKYIETGYAEERHKTLESLLDISGNLTVFNTTEAGAGASLELFIKTAKEIESRSGRRIVPWDVIKTNFYEHLIKHNYLLNEATNKTVESAYLQEEIVVNGNTIKREDLIKDMINDTLRFMPASDININVFAGMLNERLGEINRGLDADITLADEEITKLTASITPANSVEVNTKIIDLHNNIAKLESAKWQIRIAPDFSQTESQMAKLNIAQDDYLAELNTKDLEDHSEYIATYVAAPIYTGKEYLAAIEEIVRRKVIDPLTGKSKNRSTKEIIAELLDYLTANEVFNKTVLMGILSGAGTFKTKLSSIYDLIKEDSTKISDSYAVRDKYDAIKENIKKETSDFEQMNHLWDSVITEIKKGNLDKELFELLKTSYNNSLSAYSKVDKNKFFTPEELLVLLQEINDTAVAELEVPLNLFDNFLEITTTLTKADLLASLSSITSKTLKDKLIEKVNTLEEEDLVAAVKKIGYVVIPNIIAFKQTNKQDFNILVKSQDIIDDPSKFISNSIYDFIKDFDVSLNDNEKKRQEKLLDILKREEYALSKASDITTYLADGVNTADILQAINTLKLMKAVINGMSTTTISLDDPVGFIATRQQFAKANNTGSKVTSLKTISSDMATMMVNDLERISGKLEFLRNLLLNNSGKIFVEQETIRRETNKLILTAWKNLIDKSIILAGNPAFDDIEGILKNDKISDEKKLLLIEEKFYKKHKNTSLADKQAFVRELNKFYPSINNAIDIYNNLGSNEITKDIKELSNNDWKLYLISNLSLNSRDFNTRILNILETDFDKSPFFTQELAVKIAYASIVDPDLFSVVTEQIDPTVIRTSLITYLLGDGGTGKTSVGLKMLALLLQNNNPNLHVWFSGPHKDQAINLKNQVLSSMDSSKFTMQTYNKVATFEALGLGEIYSKLINPATKVLSADKGNSNLVIDEAFFDNIPIQENLPDVILIDEATYYGAHELYLLNKFVEKAKEAGKYIKIIAAGDISQKGYEFEGVSFNVDYVSGIFTPRLSLTVRALNAQKRKTNQSVGTIAKFTRQNWERSSDDSKVLNIIGTGISLPYYHTKDMLNGDFLTEDGEIPDSILQTLGEIVKTKSDTKISILNEVLDLDPNLIAKLEKNGITSANYQVYTQSNIQGAEGDYFIFNLSHIPILAAPGIVATLASKIRALNTYLTRAKHATIIINDSQTNLPFSLIPLKENYPQLIEPLSPEVIKEDKAKRITILKELLDGNTKIEDDFFKFSTPNSIDETIDEIMDTSTITSENIDEVEDPREVAYNTTLSSGKGVDDNKFMVHSFYNDLNAEIISNSDGTFSIKPNANNNFYGLNLQGKVSLNDLNSAIDQLVSAKYDILGNKKHTGEFRVNGRTVHEKAVGSFVVRTTSFDRTYNSPYGKLYGDTTKIFPNNTSYANLFYKVMDSNGDEMYIHLATLPALGTVEKAITGGQKSAMYQNYKTFLEGTGKELPIDIKDFDIHTSTRLVKSGKWENGVWVKDDAKRQEFTMNDLAAIPGLRFFDRTANKFTVEPKYFLFPNDEKEFNQVYKSFSFKGQIDANKLHEMFLKYKGKGYAIISFIRKGPNSGGREDSQSKLIILKSKKKSLFEVRDIIIGAKPGTVSLREMLLGPDKATLGKRGKALKNTLFNGSQIVDLLVNLAVKKPDLFEALLVSSQKSLEGLLTDVDTKNDPSLIAFVEDYKNEMAKAVQKVGGNNIIERISYNNTYLKAIYEFIGTTVAEAKKSGKPLEMDALKRAVIVEIKKGDNKKWFYHFWNIFAFEQQMSNLALNPRAATPLQKFAETTSDILNEIFAHWDQALKDSNSGIYYNLPLTGITGTRGFFVDPDAAEDNAENLYTDMAPEGPYLLLNTVFGNPIIAAPSTTTTPTTTTPVPVTPTIVPPTPISTLSSTTSKLQSNLFDSTFSASSTKAFTDTITGLFTQLSKVTENNEYNAVLIDLFRIIKHGFSEDEQKDVSKVIANIKLNLEAEAVEYQNDPDSINVLTDLIKNVIGINRFYNLVFQTTSDPSAFNLQAVNDLLMNELDKIVDISLKLDYADAIDNITTKCKLP